jgi:hypothetical protein
MSLWIAWSNAIALLRPAFSRQRSFLWFVTAVAGLTVRTELRYQHGCIQGRLITIFNRRKALDRDESRLDGIDAAQIRLAKGQTIKPEIAPFFGKNGNVLRSKLDQEKKYDGVSFVFTTSKLSIADASKLILIRMSSRNAFNP